MIKKITAVLAVMLLTLTSSIIASSNVSDTDGYDIFMEPVPNVTPLATVNWDPNSLSCDESGRARSFTPPSVIGQLRVGNTLFTVDYATNPSVNTNELFVINEIPNHLGTTPHYSLRRPAPNENKYNIFRLTFIQLS